MECCVLKDRRQTPAMDHNQLGSGQPHVVQKVLAMEKWPSPYFLLIANGQ